MLPTTNCTTLSELPVGEQATLLTLPGGRGLSARLVAIGFTPGVQVSMTQNYGRGPLIVAVRGARVALGRGEAQRIVVERHSNE
jgi:ferrous iron transport protein A